MKKIAVALVTIVMAVVSANAQYRIDSEGNKVYHPFFAVAEWQMADFDIAKESSAYGLGLVFTSISHWDKFHVGANVNFSVNAGLLDDWGCIVDFGPSVRYDISNRIFVNMPVNATCYVTYPEGTTDTETSCGAKIAPSLHAFLSDKFGVFVGPQVSFAFSGGSEASFGFQAGISYCW